MNRADLAEFPQALQDLIKAELLAGNSIVEVCGGFPAPPVGACVKLARCVTTRARESDPCIDFYERNNSDYSGEFTDAKRFYFVLEPPRPPDPEPDMDAIRAEREDRQRAADAALQAEAEREAKQLRNRRAAAPVAAAPQTTPRSPLVERFRESMEMNYERWHDGTGYALDLLQSATPDERAQIEALLISGGVKDWRDVEALAALDSPRTRAVLRRAFERADDRLKVALISDAPELFNEDERTAALVSALENAEAHGGLTQALLLAESFHPSRVIDALLRGVLARDGGTAGHFAAMLLFLHGEASSSYDMKQRPFFLKFQDGDRRVLFRELCERIGVDPAHSRGC